MSEIEEREYFAQLRAKEIEHRRTHPIGNYPKTSAELHPEGTLAWLPLSRVWSGGRWLTFGLIAHTLDIEGVPLCGQRLDYRYKKGGRVPVGGRECKNCEAVLEKMRRLRCQK